MEDLMLFSLLKKIIKYFILIITNFFYFKLIFKHKNILNNFIIEKNAYFKMYLNLQNKLFQNDNSSIEKDKQAIFNLFFYGKSNSLTSIDKIYYTCNFRFGNILVNLNKLIFYCEIIGCKSIVLDKNNFWFIKSKIYIPQINISIETGDYNNSLYLFDNSNGLFYSLYIFRPEIRINFIRKEIISNLPKIKTSKENLYIHIRSGDIFSSLININKFYSQPPFCFYKAILNNYNFSKIFLISVDNFNYILKIYINEYIKNKVCK